MTTTPTPIRSTDMSNNSSAAPQWFEHLIETHSSSPESDKYGGSSNHTLSIVCQALGGPSPTDELLNDDLQSSLHESLSKLLVTDLEVTRRVVRRYGKFIRYVSSTKTWLIWNRRQWQVDEIAAVQRLVQYTIRLLRYEAEQTDSRVEDDDAKYYQHSSRIKAVRELLSSQSEIAATTQQFVPSCQQFVPSCFELPVQNGCLDLQSGRLREHDPSRGTTATITIVFDGSAKAPTWASYLDRVMPDSEDRLYLQRAVGYTFTGDTTEQCFFYLYGDGSNGKSTFTNVLEKLLGDYAGKLDVNAIQVGPRYGASNHLGGIVGKRLVSVTEIPSQVRLNEALIKDVTGNETITIRKLYQEDFNYRPECKLWVYGNSLAEIEGTDDGIWRRVQLIRFNQKIEAGERDPDLGKKLKAELPGILNWALEGFSLWKLNGLAPPQSVRDAVAEYRTMSDPVARFLAESTTSDSKGRVRTKYLLSRYIEWATANGERLLNQTAFSKALIKRGLQVEHTRDGSVVVARAMIRQLSMASSDSRKRAILSPQGYAK